MWAYVIRPRIVVPGSGLLLCLVLSLLVTHGRGGGASPSGSLSTSTNFYASTARTSTDASLTFIASEIRAPLRVDYFAWDGSTVWATGFDRTNKFLALGHLVDGQWELISLPNIAVRGAPLAVNGASVCVPSLSRTFVVFDKRLRTSQVYNIPEHPVLPSHPAGLSGQALGGMAAGPDGRFWYITQNTAFIGNFEVVSGQFQEVALPITQCKFAFEPMFVGSTLYWLYKQTGQVAAYDTSAGKYIEMTVMPDTSFPLDALTPALLAQAAFIDSMAYDAGRNLLWVVEYNRGQLAAVRTSDGTFFTVPLGTQLDGVGILRDKVVCSQDSGWLVYDPHSQTSQSIPFAFHVAGRLGAVGTSSPVDRIYAAEIESTPFQFSDGVAQLLIR